MNAANARGATGFGDLSHDGINRGILIETRARRLGVYGLCEKCEGHGYVYTKPAAHLNVVLWIIHPRKGASRGVRIQDLTKPQAQETLVYLMKCAARNAERFARVVEVV